MGGNRANPEENHPEAGRLTIHLQTSCSTQNELGSNSGKAVGKFTSGSNSSQANLFIFIFVLHSALRTPIGRSSCLQSASGEDCRWHVRQTSPEDGGEVQSSVSSDQGNV